MIASNAAAPRPGRAPERWIETLLDGSRIGIRPLAPRDAAAERAFIEALSPQARRYRFLGQFGHPTSDLVARFTRIDHRHEIAYVAIAPEGTQDRFVGIARYGTSTDGASCECTVAVLDDWQHKGVGTALMKHLIEIARSRRILYMYSVDASDDADMAAFARHLGFTRTIDPGDPTLAVHGLWL